MKRPILDRPTEEQWRTDDEELGDYADKIKRLFDIEQIRFRNPETMKEISYKELMLHLNLKRPDYEYIATTRKFMQDLPEFFENLKDRLFIFLERFTFNAQERARFIQQQEEYIDSLIQIEGEEPEEEPEETEEINYDSL